MHALGLSLDFLFGRGYLSARGKALGEWVTVESLRMEIPDLTFPFDARGGVERFRNTRCHVRRIQLTISETGLQAALNRALEELQGFEALRLRFSDGAIHATVRFRTLGSDTFLTFKVGVIPPEPARADALHLIVHDVRAYGPLPYPGRLLISELIARLLATPQLQRLGRDKLYRIEHQGDLIELRPLKLGLMALFPPAGWKMPSLAGIVFDAIDIHPGGVNISAHSDGDEPPRRDAIGPAISGPGAAAAMAAYEARDLCREADAALWEGQLEAAIETLHGLRELYGLHPALVTRLLDALLASSGTGHLAEARALLGELTRADPDDLLAHLAAPTVALLRGDQAAATAAYEALAEQVRRRGEGQDLIACLVAGSMTRRRSDPAGAAHMLREVLQLAPRHRLALELLRDLYIEQDQPELLVDVLRRLTSLYTERASLLELYQALADHLMRRGDLAEARLYLDKILGLDPTRLEALRALGESYMLDGQPLRALKAFGSASREAEAIGDRALVAELHLKTAELWAGPLDDLPGALLACRRALGQAPEHRRALSLALDLARRLGRHDEALDFIDALIPRVEREVELAQGTERAPAALSEAHRVHLQAAAIASARQRPDTAAAHHRRALSWRRTPGFPDEEAGDSVDFLDQYYRQMGRPDDLLDLYRSELALPALPPERRARLHRALAVIFDQVLGLGSEAVQQLQAALDLDPHDEPSINQIVDVLGRDGRALELRDGLRDLDARVTDRRIRGLVLRHLGALHLDALPDPGEAARLMRQSMLLRPADGLGAEMHVRAERAVLIEDPGADQRPLLKALERLGEVGQSDDVRHAALMEAGDLCFERLAGPSLAAGFYQRALSLRPDPRAQERLSVIHARTGYGASKPAPSAILPAPPPLPPLPPPVAGDAPLVERRPAPEEIAAHDLEPETRVLTVAEITGDFHVLPAEDPLTLEGSVEPPTILAPLPKASLASFRNKIQQIVSKPARLEDNLSVLSRLATAPPRVGAASPEGAALEPPSDNSLKVDRITPSITDTTPRTPEDELLDALSESLDLPLPTHDTATRRMPALEHPPEAPEPSVTNKTSARRMPLEDVPTRPMPIVVRNAVREEAARARRLEEILARVTRARESGDPGQLRDTLEEALAEPEMEHEARGRLVRELGLLYYYDLELLPAAEEYLTKACTLDPEGIGGDFDVLTALEGIYEDMGLPEKLLDIYRRKRRHARDTNMRRVYTLLSAELLWERLGRPDEAREELATLLRDDASNVPALRMMADIARQLGQPVQAMEHLRQIIAHQPPGDFDLLEALRELSQLLLDHIGDDQDPQIEPDAAREEAVEVLKHLLREAPGDGASIAALRPLQQHLGDLDGALATLGMELGLLLGRRGDFNAGPSASALATSDVSPPLIIPVSQILTEAGDLRLRLGQEQEAIDLYGLAVELWPENIEALSQHLDLLRGHLSRADAGDLARLSNAEQLARGLDSMAGMLLAAGDKFEALHEAAAVFLDHLDAPDRARSLLIEALDIVEGMALPHHVANLVDDAQARLSALNADAAPLQRPKGKDHHSTLDLLGPTQQVGEFPLTSSSSSIPARKPGEIMAPSPISRPNPIALNPFGLPPLVRPARPIDDSLAPEPWLDPDNIVVDDFDDLDDLDAPDEGLDVALQRAEQAELESDRPGLIDALEIAIEAALDDEHAPAAMIRQLFVRQAEALLGLRPLAPLGQAHHQRWIATPSQNARALQRADDALSLEDCDEPEAHFARVAALRALEEHAEALEALETLAFRANHWLPENDLDDDLDDLGLDLESRIVAEVLQTLTEGRAMDRRDEFLHRLGALNVRIAKVIELENIY